MEAKVLTVFRDKDTGKIHQPGDTITITKKRFDEITGKLGGGFIKAVPGASKKKRTVKKKKKAGG
ncbi:MAG: hypothetical protein GX878_11625 [Firmicutes bacterium]|nr:hypothetical protein [Bacillota bacterium]